MGGETTRREALARSAQAAAAAALLSGPAAGVLAAGPDEARADVVRRPLAVAHPPLDTGAYRDFADAVQPAMEHAWHANHRRSYGRDVRVNAVMLGVHALAALAGHDGPSRNDRRARRLVAALLASPPYIPSRGAGGTGVTDPQSELQNHTPGWRPEPGGTEHVSVDPKVCEALALAHRARGPLGLSARTAARIRHQVDAVARGVFFRYPQMRLNQVNWYTGIAISAAEVTGRTDLVRGDARRQLVRFLRGARTPVAPWRIPNLGLSWNFHRAPFSPLHDHQNIESAEYANIILEILSHERRARALGMAPLGRSEHHVLRAWALRALPAYWTHSGYMNWDSGLYLQRWHLGAYWGFALQGLLALALDPPRDTGRLGAWAKWVFDRALGTYARLAAHGEHRIPDSPVFPIRSELSDHPALFAARFQYMALRAAQDGLGRRDAAEPPPMYAYDPQIGRLTVSTPAYNTAIVAVSNGAFPYGGLDPARLFDGDQRVAATIGGIHGGAFGVSASDHHGRIVVRSQETRRTLPSPGRPPLDLVRSPQGRIRAGRAHPADPYAGGFGPLEVTGVREGGGVRVRSTHAFARDHLISRWTLTRRTGAARAGRAQFPTWGRAATITAVLHDGSVVTVADRHHLISRALPLHRVAWLHLDASGDNAAGYVLVVRSAPRGATLAAGRPQRSSSSPIPGPTLVVHLTPRPGWRRATLAVAYGPVRSRAQARALAARLRG